ncbi:RNA methyltransferase [Weeksellaceae bacterium A-14]
MLTAHIIKVIQSLDKKKFRQKYNLFLVEGNKTIVELQNSDIKVREIFSTEPDLLDGFDAEITRIDHKELHKISQLQHPKDSVALCHIPERRLMENAVFNLVLDGIQDPGNMGTMIRLADWFGIEQIVCSEDSVDVFNPKVIQASMGSFTRVNVVYTSLPEFLQASPNISLGTDMDGDNIYKAAFPENINLIMGNEGNGMRMETRQQLQKRLSIPRFGNQKKTESLNVSVAASIILGEIFSRKVR